MQYALTEQDWLGISESQFVRYLLWAVLHNTCNKLLCACTIIFWSRISANVLYCTFSSVNHQVSESSLKNIFPLIIGLMLNQVQSPQALTAKPEGEIHQVWVPSCLWMFSQPTFEVIPNLLASNSKSVRLQQPEGSAGGQSAARPPQPRARSVRPSRHGRGPAVRDGANCLGLGTEPRELSKIPAPGIVWPAGPR